MKKLLIFLSAASIMFSNSVIANAKIIHNTTNIKPISNEQTSESSDILREPSKALWPEDAPKIASKAAIVMEASTGAILYAKNIHETYYPASITKILTTLLAAENSSLGETVTFSHDSVYDVEADSSRLWIDENEELTMEQCLYGIMLESANDVAYAVAEHISGDVDSFSELMNQRAAELGCVDSNFVNPHGLPDPDHVTSAYDMALISRAAINNQTFREVTGTRTFTIPPTNLQKETRYLNNHHRFIKKTIPYEGAIGGKTGYTSKAKYTLVTFAERNGVTLISVILYCDSIQNEYSDTSSILDYAFNNYTLYSIADMEEPSTIDTAVLFTKYSSLFNDTNSRLQISPNGNIILPNSADYTDAKKEIQLSPVSSIVEGDNIIGKISYSYDGLYVGSADIIYNNLATFSPLEDSFIPSPTPVTQAQLNNSTEDEHSYNWKPIIISVMVGILILAIVIYIIIIELPYRRKKNAYHQKKLRKKKSSDFIDL